MANGAMTTNTSGEKEVRQQLVEDSYIDCVVQLPEKLFYGTGIPCCLFFLVRIVKEKRDIEIVKMRFYLLMLVKKEKWLVVDKRLSHKKEINEIAAIYHAYKTGEGKYEDIQGFCKVATIGDVKGNDYKLTPGIYVGAEEVEIDDVPFEKKMGELMNALQEQFADSDRMQNRILHNLEELL